MSRFKLPMLVCIPRFSIWLTAGPIYRGQRQAAVRHIRDRFNVPVSDADIEKLPYITFPEGSQYPVSEITIAGNLKDMWRNIVTVGASP